MAVGDGLKDASHVLGVEIGFGLGGGVDATQEGTFLCQENETQVLT